MNYISNGLTYFRPLITSENIRNLRCALNPIQKRISLLAILVLSALAVSCISYYFFCIRAKKRLPQQEDHVLNPVVAKAEPGQPKSPPVKDNVTKAQAVIENHGISLDDIKKDGLALQHVPLNERTEELCLAAIKQNVEALQYVPESCYSGLVKKASWIINYIPKDKQTEELCLSIVQQNGSDLGYIPEEKRTHKVCLAAVKNFFGALKKVPLQMRNEEICLAAVKQLPHYIESVPEELHLAIIKQVGNALKYLAEDKRTIELCLAAVKNEGTALEFVPEDKRSEEICLAAVQNDGKALKFVPLEKRK